MRALDRLVVGVPVHPDAHRRRRHARRVSGPQTWPGPAPRVTGRPGRAGPGARRGGQLGEPVRGAPARRRQPSASGPTCSSTSPEPSPTPASRWRRPATRSGTREKWFASSEGSRIDQHIVECGAVMDATAIGDGETQRRSYPGVRGQYGTRGWELVRELDLLGNAATHRRRGPGAAARAAVPGEDHHADPRQRADGAADPRVGRPRHRARPHPRVGGRLRGHVVARPRAARVDALRVRPDEHHRRRHAARRPRQLRLRRRGRARAGRRHRQGRHLGRGALRAGLGAARRAARPGAWCAPTAPPASRWCA